MPAVDLKDALARSVSALRCANNILIALQRDHELGNIDLGNQANAVELYGKVVYDELAVVEPVAEKEGLV